MTEAGTLLSLQDVHKEVAEAIKKDKKLNNGPSTGALDGDMAWLRREQYSLQKMPIRNESIAISSMPMS